MIKRPTRPAGAALASLLLVALATTAAPVSAGGGGSCVFDPSTHVATASPVNPSSPPSDLTVVRSGDNILVNGTVCGTVTTLDKMIFQVGTAGVTVTFLLGGGPFEPGYTNPSNDTGEIEFDIQRDDKFGFGQRIELVGSDGNEEIDVGDSLVLGQSVVGEINLNANVDVDADIFVSAPISNLDVRLSGGHDQLSGLGLGGGPFAAGPTSASMQVQDGPGNDVIVGGGGTDVFATGTFANGADTYKGSGNDFVSHSERETAVTVTFNDVDDDGWSCPGPECEGDNVGEGILGVFSGRMSDKLVGGPGRQILHAGEGHNLLRGLGGKDDLSGGNGNDDFRGGDGFDLVSHSSASGWSSEDPGLEITIDDKPGDGVPGEHDNVHTDVEGLVGTISPDILIGSDEANRLYGSDNDDVLRGGPGNDTLNGGETFPEMFGDGNDRYFGGSGRDTVEFALLDSHLNGLEVSLDDVANDRYIGGFVVGIDNVRSDVENVIGSLGPDLLVGSALNNRLEGKAGDDTLKGLGGNDTLLGGPHDDTLRGGAGDDSCQQDGGTGTISDCE